MTDIDEIKAKIDLVSFIGKRVPLKKAGRNLKGLCPFHTEKTPSFMVSPDRNVWHCFGCGKGGSVFDFFMQYYHVDFREALEDLAEEAGVKLTRRSHATPEEKKKEALLELHHIAGEYFHFLLTSHAIGEQARLYLSSRGVRPEIIKTFYLGYAPNSWDSLSVYLKKKGYENALLEASGLFVSSFHGRYDRFRGRVMFPLKNHRGQIIAFAGRLLNESAKEAKYINSPETILYKKGQTVFGLDVTKSSILREDCVVVMEGEFDVLSSFQAGISNVVAIKGTAITEDQVYLLKRFAKRIVFSLDGDIAGDKASWRGVEIAEKAGMELYVASLPKGNDPDDLARSAPHVLKRAIDDALSIYDYYVLAAQKGVDLSTPYGKKHVVDELAPILSRIDHPIIQAHYIKKLARLLSVTEDSVIKAMQKAQRSSFVSSSKKGSHTGEHVACSPDIYLLALLLQGDPSLLKSSALENLEAITVSSIKQIMRRLCDSASRAQPFVLHDFLASLPKEWSNIVDQAMTWDVGDIINSRDRLTKEWERATKDILKTYYRRVIQSLTEALKRGDEDNELEINKTREKIAEYAKKLFLVEKE